MCKFKLFRAPEPIVRGPHLQPESFLKECMDARMFACPSSGWSCGMDLAMEMFGGNRETAAQILLVHSNLRVFALPECVAVQQLESMDRMHGSCSAKLQACQRITFCSVCAINGKGFASKMRICCLTKQMSCITCPPGTVVTVNMLGVLLKVCSIYFYLCPYCISLRVWTADCNDLCPWALRGQEDGGKVQCRCNGNGSVQQQQQQPCCMVCHCKNLCRRASLLLPDVERRVMKRVHLCNRHAPPEHLLGMVTSTEEFDTVVREYNANKGLARKARRRMAPPLWIQRH